MLTSTVITAVIGVFSVVAAGIGINRIIRDPRRIAAYAYAAAGLGAALLSLGVILYLQAGSPVLLGITMLVALALLLLGNLVGYPALVGFLLWAGITNVRRESRSLANLLALLAGIGLLLLPGTLAFLAPTGEVRNDIIYHLQYGSHLGLLLLVTYVSFCFGAFAVASVAYRLRKIRNGAAAIIVLGSGLVHGEVTPLLAGRLQRGITAHRNDTSHPMIITSGGKGDDEPRSEGAAMRDYLLEHGMEPGTVVAEEASRTTAENLLNSRRFLPDPTALVTVVTSSYHVFRAALLTRGLGMHAQVVGAPTAWYYLPGAVIREFIAVMRDHLRIHAVVVAAIIVLTIAFTTLIVPAMVVPS